jgi:hypothetical protein
MNLTAKRPYLLHRTLRLFVVLVAFLVLSLWAGKTFIERQSDRTYLDTQRMESLRTFEQAIVAVQTRSGYTPPTAEEVRKHLAFCNFTDTSWSAELHQALRKLRADNRVARAHARADSCAADDPHEELACYLRTIDDKLNAMSRAGRRDQDRMLARTYAVNIEKWAAAIRGTRPGNAQSQGRNGDRTSAVTCRSAFSAAKQLASRDGKLLEQLAWRDLSVPKVVAEQFAPGQLVRIPDRMLQQQNPWTGLPGCIYYGDAALGTLSFVTDRHQSNRELCTAMQAPAEGKPHVTTVSLNHKAASAAADDQLTTIPESLDVILADLDNLRLPWTDLYRAYTENPKDESSEGATSVSVAQPHGPNQLDWRRHKVDVGFNVHLTIDPALQRTVQQLARCYTGDTDTCRAMGLREDQKFTEFTRTMYERAAVRMAGVAIIDIPSGTIQALGSAHSNCYRQEYDGPGRNVRECPDLPARPHYEPDRLLNHALFTDALPGSTIKPIMAVGFMRDARYRRRITAERVSGDFIRLQSELKSSDSVAFLNRMFCSDKGWQNCDRPRQVQQAAVLAGWNSGCSEPSSRCGRLDVLFGRPSHERIRTDTERPPLGTTVLYGRLLVEPMPQTQWLSYRMIRDFSFVPQLAAACSRGAFYGGEGRNASWRKCTGGRHLLVLESEGWGQGNARATPLGVAGMLARIAAAANGQTALRLPHLIERITDTAAKEVVLAAQQFHLADPVPVEIPAEDARLVLAGMLSHKGPGFPSGTGAGTAYTACIRVFDKDTCNRIDWIAGKTGTPPYGNDGLSLAAIKSKCSLRPDRLSVDELQDWTASCSRERPYKWYAAVFKSDDRQPYFDKAIAVLTERNWHRSGPLAGKVHSPGDTGEPNASAELALRIIQRIRLASVQG